MAIKNFKNKLKEKGPDLTSLKDPSEAEDFNLVDYDDFEKNDKQLSKFENPPNQSKISEPARENVQDQFQNSTVKATTNLDLNRKQTGNKLETNRKQMKNKPETELETNRKQIVNNESQTGNKPLTKPETELETNRKQIVNKLETPFTFSSLVGIQKNITVYIYNSCKWSKDRITDAFTLEHLADVSKYSKTVIKTTIQRLVVKQIVWRYQSKEGRGGWTKYGLSDSIFKEIMQLETVNKLETNNEQTGNKPLTKLLTESLTNSPSSSSSSYINEKLTTTELEAKDDKLTSELPTDWQEIDFSELIELGIHFGQPQLKQWFDRKYCTAKEAQESIWHFGFYLKNSKKEDFKTGPLNFFMGIMAKSHYFSQPEGYLSPEELTLKQRTEDMKKRNENLKRLQEDFFLTAFETWFDSLSGAQIKALVPQLTGFEAQKACLRQMFRDAHFLTLRDNPSIDVTQLTIKAPTQEDLKLSKKEQELKSEIEWLKNLLAKHPRDEDSRTKLRNTEAMLMSLRQNTPTV